MPIRDTRYARTSDGVYVAYQVAGEGPIDMAWGFDFTGNVDLAWEWPVTGPLPRALAASCRLILHDRRGTGLSSRNVAAPNLETRVSDLRLVLRLGSKGGSERERKLASALVAIAAHLIAEIGESHAVIGISEGELPARAGMAEAPRA